jgi:hypothetical protein
MLNRSKIRKSLNGGARTSALRHTDRLVLRLALARLTFSRMSLALCGPDKGFGLAIVSLDISENAFLESFDAGKDAAPELILGQVTEESFDHVEPTAVVGVKWK